MATVRNSNIRHDTRRQIVEETLLPATPTPQAIADEIMAAMDEWVNDWNAFIHDVLGVKLDPDQQRIVSSVQYNRRTTVRSGHARGKDYVTAAIATTFLFLRAPCKIVCTAPTGRQVNSIMMAEIRGMWKNARLPLGGEILQGKIRFEDPNWFLEGFKAADKDTEAWTGYHSPNLLVAVTEASGIADETFNAIEGLLTGDSRLLLVGNPNRNAGTFYHSFRDPAYSKFPLDCLNAPNVVAKKTIIPGQVDWHWVDDHVHKPGWTIRISANEFCEEEGDFEWEGQLYRPTDLFRSRVRGMFPKDDAQKLIPMHWLELAHDRWRKWKASGSGYHDSLRLGVDVAGMGNDATCFCPRYGDIVEKFELFAKADHMETAGRIKVYLAKHGGKAFIDTIGEGAGVYSRCKEENVPCLSVKFSEMARNSRNIELKDKTGERSFVNMRAYCYWALRDALDPQLGGCLALPPDDELDQELTEVGYTMRGNGEFLLEPKDDIKARIGRSPDRADSLANTFWPKGKSGIVESAASYQWR